MLEPWHLVGNTPEKVEEITLATVNHRSLVLFNKRFDLISSGYECSLYEYNGNWTQIIGSKEFMYKGLYNYGRYHITCNQNKNELYITNKDSPNHNLIIINVDSKSIRTKFIKCSLPSNGFVFTSPSYLHIIGGGHNLKHFIFDTNNGKCVQVNDYQNEVHSVSAIYVPSKNMILLIGGVIINQRLLINGRLFWERKLFGMWKYCLLTKKTTKLDKIKFDFYNVALALTSNEKYVIIAGGLKQPDLGKGSIKYLYWILVMIMNIN